MVGCVRWCWVWVVSGGDGKWGAVGVVGMEVGASAPTYFALVSRSLWSIRGLRRFIICMQNYAMGWCNGLADPGAFGLWGFGFGDWRLELLPERRGHRTFVRTCSADVVVLSSLALHRALRRMAGLIFLLVFWVLAGACQRHGVGGFYCAILLLPPPIKSA